MNRTLQAIIIASGIVAGGTAGYSISEYLPRIPIVEKYVLPGYNPKTYTGKIGNATASGLVAGVAAALATRRFIRRKKAERTLTDDEQEKKLLGLD